MLSALDIPTTPSELPGVYDGEWKGSGEVFQSVCPATGEVLAHVKSVSVTITCLNDAGGLSSRLFCYVIPVTTLPPTGIASGTPWRAREDERSICLFQKYTRAKER